MSAAEKSNVQGQAGLSGGQGKVGNIDVEKDVRAIVAEILEIEPDQLSPTAHFVKELGMDSMMALEVLATIEKKYRIAIPEGALAKFTDLNKTVAVVKDVLAKK